MEKFKKNISVLALILGLTLAFTGSAFKPAVDGNLHAKVNDVWEDIPDNLILGQDYTCGGSGSCTAMFEAEEENPTDQNVIPNSIQPGTFQQ